MSAVDTSAAGTGRAQRGWKLVPSVATTAARSPLVTLGVAGWIALVGPVARAARLPDSAPVALGLLAGAAVVVALVLAPWWARLGVAAAAAALAYPAQGLQISALLLGGLVLAPWVARGRPPLPFLRPPTSGIVVPVVALCGVSAWVGSRPSATWQGFVPLLVAFLVTAFPFPGRDHILRLAERVGDVVGRATSAVLFELLAAGLVVVPWAMQRALAIDALAGAGWRERDRRPLQPGRLWAPEPAPGTRSPRPRVRVAVVLLCMAVVAGVLVWRWSGDGSSTSDDLVAAADDRSGGAGWHDQYREDIAWVLDERVAFRPFEVYRLLDVESRTVNIHGGYRDSARAPSCDCRRVKVWLYGGSGAFGLEQRDGHTIASELVSAARRDGIVVDVENRGIPGQLHWRTSLRFAWDLTTEDPPDLVVFYEGAEEVESALQLTDKRLGDVRAPYEPLAENLYDEIEGNTGAIPPPPSGASFLGWPLVPDTADAADVEPGVLAARRFQRSLQISDDTAADAKVPVRYFWQPSRGAHRIERSGADAPVEERRGEAAFLAAASELGPEVTDLSRVFDAVDRPVFTDVSNLGEHGAGLVAEAMYRDLRAELRAIATGSER